MALDRFDIEAEAEANALKRSNQCRVLGKRIKKQRATNDKIVIGIENKIQSRYLIVQNSSSKRGN